MLAGALVALSQNACSSWRNVSRSQVQDLAQQPLGERVLHDDGRAVTIHSKAPLRLYTKEGELPPVPAGALTLGDREVYGGQLLLPDEHRTLALIIGLVGIPLLAADLASDVALGILVLKASGFKIAK